MDERFSAELDGDATGVGVDFDPWRGARLQMSVTGPEGDRTRVRVWLDDTQAATLARQIESAALREPGAGAGSGPPEVRTHADLLRAAAALLDEHAPDLPAPAWVTVWPGEGLGQERQRELLADLAAAGASAVASAAGRYLDVRVAVGPSVVKFRFFADTVAEFEPQWEQTVAQRWVWTLIPPARDRRPGGGRR